jgi:DNA polymerase-3 subunit alpha (Gram-positive type)
MSKLIPIHVHTEYSLLDGMIRVGDLVDYAVKNELPAIAITDHGDVQGFTEASHAISGPDDIKIIYGVEAYIVDDLKGIVTDSAGQSLQEAYVVFDIETTGFSPELNHIIEIGAVKVENGKIIDRFSTFVNPKVPIPYRIEELTHINDSMVIHAPTIDEVLPKFLSFCEGCVMVAHNADFDVSFIKKKAADLGIVFQPTYVDTVAMARFLLPSLNRFKLDTVAKAVGVNLDNHHRAVDDAACTAEIFVKFIVMLEERGIITHKGTIVDATFVIAIG